MIAVALALVPFLPLYIERTMMRSWRMDQRADIIEWGWKLTSVTDYWSHYHYFKSEQQRALWLAVNLGLAFTYALVIAVGIDQFFARFKRRGRLVH